MSSLNFNLANYASGSRAVDGQQIRFRAYEDVGSVQNPEDAQDQSMIIYVPEAEFTGGQVGGSTAQTGQILNG